MTDSEPGAGDREDPLTELCDLCGVVISDSTEVYSLVRDSSAIHAHDSQFDGKRMIVACSPEHLDELIRQFKRRPFVEDDLWAGKIARVMQQHPEGISVEALAEEASLNVAEVGAGVRWHNREFLRWPAEFGEGGDDRGDDDR
ncbi:hypothetical protein AR457_37250 [Streptomyces agglomeratus]|uniref:Uncharacterized protein n=1 Tax=Streptomyces agglomeratus TaxID=285458 RepID=A0A1E5NYR0_9ACTN|nr:hypothetical protein [Streptomyces agglomeratus]OEJ21453.1 hypothetical protein AS594_38480 [Streptomyces agglomeratus]OEJ22886.1 hypothetical protein AR457_37250 [Streptomyces agglomeratus]OEJ36463.1 hypothetical protein BGK72_37740 [Streptomyces agglomeratus]OEJ56523.1 hypothetical protein BGM19_38355 [Streptomyces agglomeratus]